MIKWGETVDECLYYVRIINDINSKNSNNTNNIFNLYLSAIPKAIVNCLNFGNPQDTMGDFADTVDKLRKDCEKYKIPVVGGNVSLYNATDDVSIKPTPILLMVSILLNKLK